MGKVNSVIALASVLLLSALVTAADERPAKESLLGGKVEFTPPGGDWERAHVSGAGDAAAYMNKDHKDHKGLIALQVLPADAEMSPQMGGAIVRQLRQNHKQAGQKIVMDPKVERDPRFDLRVHEKFQQGEKTIEQLHLYRNLGPRVVMVTAQAQADNDEQSKPTLKAGEDLALSAKWIKPVGK
jgi:hypothetical protein